MNLQKLIKNLIQIIVIAYLLVTTKRKAKWLFWPLFVLTSVLLSPWILIMIILAGFISYSRVKNNYHTTQQVIIGSILGCLFGTGSYVLIKYILEGNITSVKEMIKIKMF